LRTPAGFCLHYDTGLTHTRQEDVFGNCFCPALSTRPQIPLRRVSINDSILVFSTQILLEFFSGNRQAIAKEV
jgi:hypothetical protein